MMVPAMTISGSLPELSTFGAMNFFSAGFFFWFTLFSPRFEQAAGADFGEEVVNRILNFFRIFLRKF